MALISIDQSFHFKAALWIFQFFLYFCIFRILSSLQLTSQFNILAMTKTIHLVTLCHQFLELWRPSWQPFSIVSFLLSRLLVLPASFQLLLVFHRSIVSLEYVQGGNPSYFRVLRLAVWTDASPTKPSVVNYVRDSTSMDNPFPTS